MPAVPAFTARAQAKLHQQLGGLVGSASKTCKEAFEPLGEDAARTVLFVQNQCRLRARNRTLALRHGRSIARRVYQLRRRRLSSLQVGHDTAGRVGVTRSTTVGRQNPARAQISDAQSVLELL